MASDWIEHNRESREPEPVRSDYTLPIARQGEQQFACILRNRSGFDAGNIDFGLRDLSSLVDAEQQDACDTAYALYRAICDQTGNIAAAEAAGISRVAAAERARVVALINQHVADMWRDYGETTEGALVLQSIIHAIQETVDAE